MQAIHITNSGDNYEIVDVIKDHVSESNSLAVIRNSKGKLQITGGILIPTNDHIIRILDEIHDGEIQRRVCEAFRVNVYKPNIDYSELTSEEIGELSSNNIC